MFKIQVIYLGTHTPNDEFYVARIPVVGDALTGAGSVDRVVGVRLQALPTNNHFDQVVATVFCQGSDEF